MLPPPSQPRGVLFIGPFPFTIWQLPRNSTVTSWVAKKDDRASNGKITRKSHRMPNPSMHRYRSPVWILLLYNLRTNKWKRIIVLLLLNSLLQTNHCLYSALLLDSLLAPIADSCVHSTNIFTRFQIGLVFQAERTPDCVPLGW
jgi:hypothetical protein